MICQLIVHWVAIAQNKKIPFMFITLSDPQFAETAIDFPRTRKCLSRIVQYN
jgi:hypothetical protein